MSTYTKAFRYLGSVLIVGVVAIAAVSMWRAHGLRATSSSKQIQQIGKHVHLARTTTPVPVNRRPAGAPEAGSAAIDYRKSFADAHDYWAFAHQALPAAKAGNADAQYYLSKVLERCDEDNRMYFQRGDQRLTLDEGLQFAVKRHLSIDVAQTVYDRCHAFQEHDTTELGNAPDWLAKATMAGQPLAQTTTAEKALTQAMLENSARAGGVPNPNGAPTVKDGTDPQALLRSALTSKDPEVLFNIGEAQSMLDPSSTDANTNRFAWWLVACERGFDCSDSADWVKNSCGDNAVCTSAGDSADRIRSLAGDQWPEVQRRAEEINGNLNADQWDKLRISDSTAKN